VPIPQGFTASTVAGEDTKAGGLVIKDSVGNEFVWVPCTLDGANGTVQYAKWNGSVPGISYTACVDGAGLIRFSTSRSF